jgi:hypothetical protein
MVSLLTALLAVVPLISALPSNLSREGTLAKRAQVICGTRGYDTGTQAYYDQQSSNQATVSACGARCTADSKCLSFAVGDNTCLTYSVGVSVTHHPCQTRS